MEKKERVLYSSTVCLVFLVILGMSIGRGNAKKIYIGLTTGNTFEGFAIFDTEQNLFLGSSLKEMFKQSYTTYDRGRRVGYFNPREMAPESDGCYFGEDIFGEGIGNGVSLSEPLSYEARKVELTTEQLRYYRNILLHQAQIAFTKKTRKEVLSQKKKLEFNETSEGFPSEFGHFMHRRPSLNEIWLTGFNIAYLTRWAKQPHLIGSMKVSVHSPGGALVGREAYYHLFLVLAYNDIQKTYYPIISNTMFCGRECSADYETFFDFLDINNDGVAELITEEGSYDLSGLTYEGSWKYIYAMKDNVFQPVFAGGGNGC